MSRTVVDAELQVYEPGGSSPFVTANSGELEEVEINERVQDEKDQGRIKIANHDQKFSGSGQITSGDKLVFRVQLEGESSLSDRWTAVAHSPRDRLLGGGRQQVVLPEPEDFVFAVLEWRLIYDTFDGAPISGSSDAILDTLLAKEASEIGTGQIETISETTDANYSGRTLMDIVGRELAPIAGALAHNDGTDLVFRPLGDVTAKHPLTPSDFRAPIKVTRDDDGLANLIRVDGGTDHEVDDEQTNQSSYTRVTNSSRLTHQLQVRKSEVDRIAVHTKVDSTSGDGITVRLQADRGGSPVDVSDQQSDTDRETLPKEDLTSDGLTEFILSDHDLPPASNPWLIIEADGADGHDIGVDSNGVPRYRAQYPFPLLTRSPRKDSQDEFRRRDKRIKDGSLGSEKAVRDKARAEGRQNDQPTRTVSGEADSLRAHQLEPGEAVEMQGWGSSVSDVSGTWICTARQSDFDGSRNELTTNLTLTEADSL